MEYAVEMGSDAMIYISSFIKTGSAIQTLKGGGGKRDSRTHKRHGDLISLLLFFSK
jgi:hypothetical protein